MDLCPFCAEIVDPNDPDRVVINNSGTVCHDRCLEEAKANTKKVDDGEQTASAS